uniref:WAP domain-containing protein n=1 Tax=Panagrolaimus superbus TaxID=310955 RepID=A0A914YWF5_9BILA
MNWHLSIILVFIFLIVVIFGLETKIVKTTDDPLTDTSIESPISSLSSKKSNVSTVANLSDENVKKSIQAKVKKLRQLKLEARQIASQLRRERRIKAIEGKRGGGGEGNLGEEKVEKLKKWKNRMRRRVKALIKRVTKMEKAMKLRKSELQTGQQRKQQKRMFSTAATPFGVTVIPVRKNKSFKKAEKKKSKQAATTTVSPPMTLTTISKPTIIPKVVSTSTIPSTALAQTPIITTTQKVKVLSKRSHFGVDGSPCETHKECAPGHCCHRFGALHGVHSAVCLRHDAKEGAHCEHSCACMGSLKCVKSSNPHSHASEQAHCRRLTSKDFAHSISSSSVSPKIKTHSATNNRYNLRYI